MDHINGTGLSRLHEALMKCTPPPPKRLERWSLRITGLLHMLVGTLWHAINKHHHWTRTLSQRSSVEGCGDTNICLLTTKVSYETETVRLDTQQSTPLNDTLKEICPRDHLMWGYITQLQIRHWLIIQMSTRLLSKIMLAWDVHEREGKPKMADVLKNLVAPQKLAQNNLDNTNMIQSNQVFTSPSKVEVPHPKYTP